MTMGGCGGVFVGAAEGFLGAWGGARGWIRRREKYGAMGDGVLGGETEYCGLDKLEGVSREKESVIWRYGTLRGNNTAFLWGRGRSLFREKSSTARRLDYCLAPHTPHIPGGGAQSPLSYWQGSQSHSLSQMPSPTYIHWQCGAHGCDSGRMPTTSVLGLGAGAGCGGAGAWGGP